MTEDQLAEIISRTDAAMALIVNLLIEKGVIDQGDVAAALEKAIEAFMPMASSPMVASVFVSLKLLIDIQSRSRTNH